MLLPSILFNINIFLNYILINLNRYTCNSHSPLSLRALQLLYCREERSGWLQGGTLLWWYLCDTQVTPIFLPQTMEDSRLSSSRPSPRTIAKFSKQTSSIRRLARQALPYGSRCASISLFGTTYSWLWKLKLIKYIAFPIVRKCIFTSSRTNYNYIQFY